MQLTTFTRNRLSQLLEELAAARRRANHAPTQTSFDAEDVAWQSLLVACQQLVSGWEPGSHLEGSVRFLLTSLAARGAEAAERWDGAPEREAAAFLAEFMDAHTAAPSLRAFLELAGVAGASVPDAGAERDALDRAVRRLTVSESWAMIHAAAACADSERAHVA